MIVYILGAVMLFLFLFVTLVLINPSDALISLFIKDKEEPDDKQVEDK